MKILIDSREQLPFTFEREKYAGTVVEVGTLCTGDYSLAGLTDKVVAERKPLSDLVACLGRERERFERELQRAAAQTGATHYWQHKYTAICFATRESLFEEPLQCQKK
jgi:hypothetical protein